MLIRMALGTVLAMPCALVAEQFPGMAAAVADSTDAALGPAATAGPGRPEARTLDGRILDEAFGDL
ncbi:MAG: hypothetical protein OXH99_16395 [Bryobacterales bacterium]|nr:hypothetical protein [Bryobacterales bacterium]